MTDPMNKEEIYALSGSFARRKRYHSIDPLAVEMVCEHFLTELLTTHDIVRKEGVELPEEKPNPIQKPRPRVDSIYDLFGL